MKFVIQMSSREEAKALPILLRHSPGIVLKDRTYVLSEEAVSALRGAGIRFTKHLKKDKNSLNFLDNDEFLPTPHPTK